jgi:hypothetical protein
MKRGGDRWTGGSMKIDIYTKLLLTVMTGALVVIAMATVSIARRGESIASSLGHTCGDWETRPCHVRLIQR